MKKKLVYILALCSSAFFTTSCEDFLDTSSLSTDNIDYVVSNVTDARKMVNHVYAYFCEDSFTSRMSNNWNQNTDVEWAPLSEANAEEVTRRGLWAHNARPSFGDINTAWNHNYEAIDFCNQIIAGIRQSELYEKGDKDILQILGEAYCLRAYRYFLLCNFWGDVPMALDPTDYDNYTDDSRTKRMDKNIIYSQMIQDMIDIEESMMWASDLEYGVERMNREFALGFITKLAMFRAGYSMQEDGTMDRCRIDNQIEPVTYYDYASGQELTAQSSDDFYKVAINYAKKLQAQRDRELNSDFGEMFRVQATAGNAAGGDMLFEIGFVTNGGGDVGWNIGLSVEGGSKGSGTTYTYLTPMYACSFDTEDQRYHVTCAPYKWIYDGKQNALNAFSINPSKWCRFDMEIMVNDKGTGINWPILRYADVLLLWAEAENELNGPTSAAQEPLARVRRRAFANSGNLTEKVTNYISRVSGSKDAFRKAIIDERAWEFGGECIRKFDLIRWNYFSDAAANTYEWLYTVGMNAEQLVFEGGEMIYDESKPIEDLNVASRLFYQFKDGEVVFLNDMQEYTDIDEFPYNAAETIEDKDVESYMTDEENIYYVDFAKYIFSVSDTNPSTNQKYEDGVKRGTLRSGTEGTWYGLTDGPFTPQSMEEIEALRDKVVPYIIPISATVLTSSQGSLTNSGYAIRNK